MRRSNSASSIPLPGSLQKKNMEQRNRERSRSGFRYSRERSIDRLVTPLGFSVRHSSLKPSAQKKALWTPSSISRESGSSLSACLSRTARPRSPFDKKKSQLTNDKKWVNDQYHKILDYVESSGLFNPELADKLRPPTMNVFVELISVLFVQLVPKQVPITSQNCTEIGVHTLKRLGYPGQLTTTTLKTINTMHGWPQFISVISWLIDRVQVLDKINEAFEGHMDSNFTVEYKKYETFYNFLSTMFPGMSYENNGIDPDQLQNELEKMRQEINSVMGTDEEMNQKNIETLQHTRAELVEISQQIQELEDKNIKLNQEIMERQNTIDDFEQNKNVWEQEIKDEIAKLDKDLSRLSGAKDALVSSVTELKTRIAVQPFSAKEKNELLGKIQDQAKLIERKTKKLNEYTLVRDTLDLELSNVFGKVEKRVDEWNILITKAFLPELECLRLRERGFTGFLEEIVAIRKRKDVVGTKLHTEYIESLTELDKLQILEESLKENLKSIDLLKQKSNEMKNSIQAMNKQNKLLIADIESVARVQQEKAKQTLDSEQCKTDERSVLITKLIDGQQKASRKKQNIVKSGVAALIGAHALLIETANQVDEKVNSWLSEAANNVEYQTKCLQATFEYLIRLKKTSEQLLVKN